MSLVHWDKLTVVEFCPLGRDFCDQTESVLDGHSVLGGLRGLL